MGNLQTQYFKRYIKFLEDGAGGRRFLSDCLDVQLLVKWIWAMASQGAASMLWFSGLTGLHSDSVRIFWGATFAVKEDVGSLPITEDPPPPLQKRTIKQKNIV